MSDAMQPVEKKSKVNSKVKDKPASAPPPPDEPGKQEAAEGGEEKMGWVSPSYSSSRSVQLDPKAMAERRCVGVLTDAPEVEPYRILRTQIMKRMQERGGNTIMVTSPLPGEGKTLTAVNLAFTFAREFKQTVLLVDCDLRRQQIHQMLGYDSDKGIIDYLLRNVPMNELIVWPGIEKLTVISGGGTIQESSELLGSPRMKELVASMKDRYPDRYVLFDAPPVLSAADTLALAPLVDHILLVVQAGKTPVPDVNRALQLLPQDKVLGIVLNRMDTPSQSYY
jgi:protein-tyrosine kinase